MKTMQFEVAGVKFRHADFLKANISRGDRLTLTPEPTNQFDALAIKIMKGDIHIKSAVGEGTTVTFSVPIPEDAADPPDKVG